MREIKFRGNNGCNWVYSEVVLYDTDYLNGEEREIGFMCTGEVEDWENGWERVCYVGEYVGLKDMDGNEIYDGDIFVDVAEGEIGKVYWNDSKSMFVYAAMLEDGEFEELGEYINDLVADFRVIGNIYENPELLNSETIDK